MPFHTHGMTASWRLVSRRCSSGSKSETVLPSPTLPSLLMPFVAKSIASASEVFPAPEWASSTTLRILGPAN